MLSAGNLGKITLPGVLGVSPWVVIPALAAAGTGGGIKGRITDSSGAVIPSAVLTATPAAGAA